MRLTMGLKAFLGKRRMKRLARMLVAAKEAKPELYRYLETLEARYESQARELRMMRWTVSGERFADIDEDLDLRNRRYGADAAESRWNPDK